MNKNLSEKNLNIAAGKVMLPAVLRVPQEAAGIVIFSHGSGSGRFSPRNNFVAEKLHSNGLATLLADLLTEQEDQNYENRFDIHMLTKRLAALVSWVLKQTELAHLRIGLFGASTGAASALRCAAEHPQNIKAVVCRGGRPDLAANSIERVTAATLLIVGSNDPEVLELNKEAYKKLRCEKKLTIVPGATHLFEEPGALELVADLSAQWFASHLRASLAVTANKHSHIIAARPCELCGKRSPDLNEVSGNYELQTGLADYLTQLSGNKINVEDITRICDQCYEKISSQEEDEYE